MIVVDEQPHGYAYLVKHRGKFMKIGQIVQSSIPAIFKYCEETEPEEFTRLQDPRYSKEAFDIRYPFCRQVARIEAADRLRYWTREYVVHCIPVRVTNDWYSRSLPLLQRYLASKGLPADFVSETCPPKLPSF